MFANRKSSKTKKTAVRAYIKATPAVMMEFFNIDYRTTPTSWYNLQKDIKMKWNIHTGEVNIFVVSWRTTVNHIPGNFWFTSNRNFSHHQNSELSLINNSYSTLFITFISYNLRGNEPQNTISSLHKFKTKTDRKRL